MQGRYLGVLALILLIVLPSVAQSRQQNNGFQFKPGQSVYVIAVKLPVPSDTPVWSNLMSDVRKNRKGIQAPSPAVVPASARDSVNNLPSTERVSIDRPSIERTTLDRPITVRKIMPVAELKLKKTFEDEFLGRDSEMMMG